jgi:hypothetical protein
MDGLHALPSYTAPRILVAMLLLAGCGAGGAPSVGPSAQVGVAAGAPGSTPDSLPPSPSPSPARGEGSNTGTFDRLSPPKPQRVPFFPLERGTESADTVPPAEVGTAADSLGIVPPLASPQPSSPPLRGGAREGADSARARQPADFGLQIRGRTAMGGTWDRFRPCEGLASQRCEGGVLPSIAPDLRLSVRGGGTVFDRVRVAVDYDGTREFDAANDLRIFYEGRPGEFLTRFEAGNVRLALPASRFLTHAVPSGHWGFRATSRAGPVELQALWAQGGGQMSTREFRLPPGALGAGGAVQEANASWDDAQYAAGQFFFLFDPALLRGYPHLDILTLATADAPPALAPAAGIRLYRYEGGPPAQDGSTTLLRAAPAAATAAAEAVSAPFRLLEDGVDYQLHRSGLWLSLKQPLRDDEALGVAYRATNGSQVGSETPGGTDLPEVRLLRGTRVAHRPGASTWRHEMRHVYRVTGSDDVDPGSIRLQISRGEGAAGDLGRPAPDTGVLIPYLQLLGLDDDLPRERLDAARIFRPAAETLEPVVGGVFVVFPTLRPFAEPPPLRSLGLSAAEAARLLGDAANPALYEAADDRARASSARFRLRFQFVTRGGAAGAAIALGAIGIREGSERVYLGSRLLLPGTDYTLHYETGQLELLAANPAPGGADADLRVTFEQLPLFAAAPTRVAGLTARLPLGGRGELNLVGLSQQERSLMRRATLGMEPSSLLMGGATAELRFGAPWLDRAFERGARSEERGAGSEEGDSVRRSAFRIPHSIEVVRVVEEGPAPVPSQVRLGGELAVSLPDPGGGAIAYLDDFEDRGEIVVPLQRSAWRPGSRPASRQGADGVLPPALGVQDAGTLVWQHEYLGPNGRAQGSLPLSAIDRRIRVAGSNLEPNVLYLSMQADAPRAWRSITGVLAPAGRDLRNVEYLEVYVAGAAPDDALVLDLGTVSEDAFAFDAAGRTSGIDAQGRPWGLGTLDREWDPGSQSWTVADDQGLWNPQCRAEPRGIYPLGDPRANCTRGNGLPDTEDLNGNGILDTDERVFRYVIRPADSDARYLAADTAETGSAFRLFRIPLDRAAGIGVLPDEIRQVRHLRLTVVGAPGAQLTLARMRLIGSRWEKRGASGVMDGLIGAIRPGSPLARVEVGPVSALSAGSAYLSPPGAGDAPQDASSVFGSQTGTEFNEQSLRIRYTGLGPDERAEVYRRYDGGPQNFLGYRQLRIWALAREGGWGAGAEALVVRVGTDADNHYLYRHRLDRVGAPRAAADWLPEVVIEFDRWIRLRAEAERLLAGRTVSPADPLVVWDDDGAYAVVITERGRAPNLAAVREISLGIWNGAAAPADGEVWINEMRLAASDRRPGLAGTVSVGLRGRDVIDAELSVTRRSGHFRELSATPTYLGQDAVSLRASVQLGKLLPSAWGLEVPLTLNVERGGTAPVFVDGTDLEARSLPDLRHLGAGRTQVQLQLRRSHGSARPWMRSTLDGVAFHLGVSRIDDDTPFSSVRGAQTHASVTYQVRPAPRMLQLLPAGIDPLRRLRRGPNASQPADRLGLQLRWTPVSFTLGTTWTDGSSSWERFGGLLAPSTGGVPEASLTRNLAHQASLSLQPLASLSGAVQLRSTSDLLPSLLLNPDAAPLLERERTRLGGLDLGREAQRDLATQLAWTPRLTSWLRLRSTLSSAFALDANPAYLGLWSPAGDAAATPRRSFSNRRTLAVQGALDPRALAAAAGLPDSIASDGWQRAAAGLLRSLHRLEVGWGNGLESRFDRVDGQPDLGYQLALGGRNAFAAAASAGPTLLADRSSRTARAQFRLPGEVGLSVSYTDALGLQAGQRGERTDRTREWPAILAQWQGVPLPSLLGSVVRNAAVTGGYAAHTRSADDRASAQLRSHHTLRLPLDVAVQWAGGLTTAYRGEWRIAENQGPTARTEQVGSDHSVLVGGAFAVPEVLAPVLGAPIGLSLRYTLAGQRECRLSFALEACLAGSEFSGHRDRLWSMQLDSRASGMNFGVQFEHRDRDTRASFLSGHQQFSLRVFGQFDLQAGQVR